MKRRAFTLIELLVVIAIIAILAAILFPVFAQARAKARQAACLSNEKQIGNSLLMYSQDFDGGFPTFNEAVYYGNCSSSSPVITPYFPNGCAGAPVETPASEWDAKLVPYVKNGNPGGLYSPTPDAGGVWHCPEAQTDNRWRSYGMSYGATYDFNSASPWGFIYLNEADIESPSDCLFAGDSGAYKPDTSTPPTSTAPNTNNAGLLNAPFYFSGYEEYYKLPQNYDGSRERPYRHNGGANYVFCDGHAKWYKADVIFPHPAAPSQDYTNWRGPARCSTAKYMAASAVMRASQAARAATYPAATGGNYVCNYK